MGKEIKNPIIAAARAGLPPGWDDSADLEKRTEDLLFLTEQLTDAVKRVDDNLGKLFKRVQRLEEGGYEIRRPN